MKEFFKGFVKGIKENTQAFGRSVGIITGLIVLYVAFVCIINWITKKSTTKMSNMNKDAKDSSELAPKVSDELHKKIMSSPEIGMADLEKICD